MSKITGAQMLIKCLENEGVEVIFGYPGGSVIPIYDAIYDSSIRHILVRHEQCAAHAADGYARATGKTGVCMATSGPGGTNLVTGIANAYMDSIPIVAITGQVATGVIGTDAFQEADITGITAPITKHNYLVKNIKELPIIIKEAFFIASTGRPGPVLIDIPVDISKGLIDENIKIKMDLKGYKPTYKGNLKQVRQAAVKIFSSKKPVIFAGGGIISSNASSILTKFARETKIPVITTLLGKGCFPEDDELSLKMAGMHGTKYANLAFTNTDLVIAVGVRFDDRITGKLSKFVPNAEIIHIDIDPAEIGKNVKTNIPIVGDAKVVLEDLNNEYKKLVSKEGSPDRGDWLNEIKELKKKYPLKYDKDSEKIKPAYIVEKIYEITKGDAIICTEVGQNQMWAAQFYKYKNPRSFISSGGLGTMGYGLPAAVGAQIGCPNKVVFDIAGDGSIQMNIQELTTAVHNKLPVKIAILNNGYLGMVRQWQELFYNRRYSSVKLDGSPDFVKLAEAYGAVGIRIEKKKDVKPAIKKALAVKNTVVMDFVVEPEENVFPMVPAGKPINQMIGTMA
ncbi:MAG: biosynthetic-type acetolactate synthase large subunit [Candidatus Omnitrophica bacterium]|nr:biosynthetic-type acetolactate synthase large subunit [Candidatus Omnitrophota bacterium]